MYAVRQILASPNPMDFRGQAGATLYNVRMAKASGETAPCREGLPPWKRGVSPYGLMAVDGKGARASDAPHVFARGMTPYNPDLPCRRMAISHGKGSLFRYWLRIGKQRHQIWVLAGRLSEKYFNYGYLLDF